MKGAVVWCIAVRSKEDFVMEETILFRKEQYQLGWLPLLSMLKTQGLILHGTKLKTKDLHGMVEEARLDIIPNLQAHAPSRLRNPEAKFYDWKEVLEKLVYVGALTSDFLEKTFLEYASKKSETEQEKEKAFLENRATLSEDEDNEDKDEESDEYSDELQFSQVGSKVDESQFNENWFLTS